MVYVANCCDMSVFASMPNKNLSICESCCQSYQQIKSRWSIPCFSGLTIICSGFEGYKKPLYLGRAMASHGFLFSIYINPLMQHDMAKIKKRWLPCAAIRTCGAWAWLWLGRLESFWNMPAFNRWAACLRSAGISRMWHGVANVFGGHRCGTTTSLRATGFANTLANIDKEWQGSSDITEFVDLRWGVTRCIPPVKYSPGEVLHDDHILVSSIYIYLLCEWAPVYTHWPYNVVVI